MISGLKGQLLPESEADFETLVRTLRERYLNCFDCKAMFSESNTHSSLGWRETQISGMCENCFTKLFAEDSPAIDELSIPKETRDD